MRLFQKYRLRRCLNKLKAREYKNLNLEFNIHIHKNYTNNIDMMVKEQIFEFLNDHPIFQLATCENGLPKVRHMLLFKADDNGLYFHSSFKKDVCLQLMDNNNVEMCFFDIYKFLQIRISGKAIVVHDEKLKQELLTRPSREYLLRLRELNIKEFEENLVMFRLVEGKALIWTLKHNFNEMENFPKIYIDLE